MDFQSLRHLLLLDIETVPQYPEYEQMPELWKDLWCTKISKAMPENFSPDEAYLQKAGIMAEFGKIICISTGFFYEDKEKGICLKMKSLYGDDERQLLEEFIKLTEKFLKSFPGMQLGGHNIKEFDVPYLCRRMIINGLKLPDFLQVHNKKPWEVNWIDTLHWWRFGDFKNYTSLHLLATTLGIPTSKDDIDGSEVQHVYHREKNLLRIVNYCQKDVAVVAQVILRFKNLPLLPAGNTFVALPDGNTIEAENFPTWQPTK